MLSTISTPGAMLLAYDTSFALSTRRQGKYLGMYVHNWSLIRSGPHYLEGYCTLFNCCCVMRPHGLLLLLQASSSSIFLSCAPAYCGTDRSGERILSHLWEHVSMFPLLGIASAANHRNEYSLRTVSRLYDSSHGVEYNSPFWSCACVWLLKPAISYGTGMFSVMGKIAL